MKLFPALILFLASLFLASCNKEDSNSENEAEAATEHIVRTYSNLQPISSEGVEQLADDQILNECEKILTALTNQGISEAFKHIRRLSPLPSSEMDDMEELTKKQLQALLPRFGKIIGHEYVSSRKIGTSVTECIYITKCENHLLRWRFYFYKPKDKWVLNTFFWDSEIHKL